MDSFAHSILLTSFVCKSACMWEYSHNASIELPRNEVDLGRNNGATNSCLVLRSSNWPKINVMYCISRWRMHWSIFFTNYAESLSSIFIKLHQKSSGRDNRDGKIGHGICISVSTNIVIIEYHEFWASAYYSIT